MCLESISRFFVLVLYLIVVFLLYSFVVCVNSCFCVYIGFCLFHVLFFSFCDLVFPFGVVFGFWLLFFWGLLLFCFFFWTAVSCVFFGFVVCCFRFLLFCDFVVTLGLFCGLFGGDMCSSVWFFFCGCLFLSYFYFLGLLILVGFDFLAGSLGLFFFVWMGFVWFFFSRSLGCVSFFFGCVFFSLCFLVCFGFGVLFVVSCFVWFAFDLCFGVCLVALGSDFGLFVVSCLWGGCRGFCCEFFSWWEFCSVCVILVGCFSVFFVSLFLGGWALRGGITPVGANRKVDVSELCDWIWWCLVSSWRNVYISCGLPVPRAPLNLFFFFKLHVLIKVIIVI